MTFGVCATVARTSPATFACLSIGIVLELDISFQRAGPLGAGNSSRPCFRNDLAIQLRVISAARVRSCLSR